MEPDINFDRLREAIEWSARQCETMRKSRVESVKEYVGAHYSSGGSQKRVPVNFLELATTIYTAQLAAKSPQVLVSTSSDELRPFAKNMQIALNQLPDELGLGETLQCAVQEALFGIGVVKVGLCSGGPTMYEGDETHDVGQPFVDLVPLDDYFVDMSAKNRSGIQFEGNDYWLGVEAVKEMYDPETAKKYHKHGNPWEVVGDDHTVQGEFGEQRAEGVGKDTGADLFKEKVWLRDVWIPSEGVVLTYAVTSKTVVRVVEWDGPEHGPYYVLGYNDVPGNLLPLPPVALWKDLHELANVVFRKLARQAEGKKTVVAFSGGQEEDAEALKRTKDGEGFRYTGQKPEQITVGGIDAEGLAFYLQTYEQFSRFAGNLDSLGGLGPVTETGVQDRMISEAASTRMSRYRARTINFVRKIFQALAWYEWTDPVRARVIHKKVPGSDIVLERVWSAETREGDFLDYNLDIDPYSMQDDTPELRLQKIMRFLQEVVIPFMPILQAQGIQVDFQALVEVFASLANLDELRRFFMFANPIPGQEVQAGDEANPAFKPANTTRTYERRNIPGASRHGKDSVMSQILMGAGVQGSSAASVGRPTG